MAKRREEMDSAMGPDEEPGEAHPAPADEALGLGGAGTEGKPGAPEGGTEPQIPAIPREIPGVEKGRPRRKSKLQETAEKLANPDPPADEDRRAPTGVQPPLAGEDVDKERKGEPGAAYRAVAAQGAPDYLAHDTDQPGVMDDVVTPERGRSRYAVGGEMDAGAPEGELKKPTGKPPTDREAPKEPGKGDEGSPGEKIRRRAAH